MSRAGSERGASLTEVVVAIVIFATVVVAFARSAVTSRRTVDGSRFEAEATTLAVSKLEQLRTRLVSHADLASGTHADPANPLRADGTTGGAYSRSWVVTSDVPETGMKRVEMRVSWSSANGARRITLVGLTADL